MAETAIEHVDVLIVGAGLSGIGAAHHLQTECPGKTFAIVEARAQSGGTWDLFRYPGVRSDSDMYTLAYAFKPWHGSQSMVDGPSILGYIRETARENGIEEKIRYRTRVTGASWSSAEAKWTVEFEHGDTGATGRLSCSFLFGNTGYYRYDAGYSPTFAGADDFRGRIVHPQEWPDDLDWAGKRIVVIGSGATAITLIPALATTAGHVTMVQRSPSYIASMPNRDPLNDRIRRVLPPKAAGTAVRVKNMIFTWLIYQLSRHAPTMIKKWLLDSVTRQLPDDYDIATHFTPHYQPWDQRMCFAPDGDLFQAITEGRASVVTDQIERFTADGLLLASGTTLEADIIITATGIIMQMLGGMTIEVDGRPVDLGRALAYKSVMLGGVPNMAFTFGYTNASWTLKSDIAAHYVCRLLNYMDAHGYSICTPVEPDLPMDRKSFLNLTAGYVERAEAVFPKQGSRSPWRVRHNYPLDLVMLRYGRLDNQIEFSGRRAADEVPKVAV